MRKLTLADENCAFNASPELAFRFLFQLADEIGGMVHRSAGQESRDLPRVDERQLRVEPTRELDAEIQHRCCAVTEVGRHQHVI